MTIYDHLTQNADWKTEKHVPAINIDSAIEKAEFIAVTVSVGKEIPHPNTTEHHIQWVSLFFKADSEKFPYEIGKTEFSAHGASAAGPNTSSIYSDSRAQFYFKTDKPGTLTAYSYCNIHGLWGNAINLKIS